MTAAMVGACGGVDGLVHCAGVSDQVMQANETPINTWQRIVDITLRSAFLICRTVGEVLVAQQRGSIVTFSSVNGRHAYGLAKAAVAMMTRNLACEWGGAGVRVNALAPAHIRTQMVGTLVETKKIDIERLEARTPLARLGEPGEVAQAAAFLLSDWATYITGSCRSMAAKDRLNEP